MRQVVVWMVVGGVALGAARAGAQLPTTPLGYAVFALEKVSLGGKGRVAGDVGSNAADVSLGPGAHVVGSIAAATVHVRHGARATTYYCAALDGTDDTCSLLPSPVVPPSSLIYVQVRAGSADISLKRRKKQTTPLPPLAYGNLQAGGASELLLQGGTYSFLSVTLGPRAKVLCVAPCEIDVHDKVTLGGASRLGAATGVAASDVLVKVQSDGEPVAFEAGSRTAVTGSVYAPGGTVKLGGAGRYEGAFVGAAVTVGPRARVKGPSGP